MSDMVCYLDPSLESVVLYDGGSLEEWAQPHVDVDEEPASIEVRAQSCASFVMSRPGRLSTVVVGIEHAGFRWVVSPTNEASVVATVVKRRMGEEQPGPVTATVQPLDASPAKQSAFLHRISRKPDTSAAQHTSSHTTVLTLEDGPVRLWFDALDRNGVMPRDVMTTWHAIARVWGRAQECRMVVCEIPTGHLVWSLCREGSVLVGGQVARGDTHTTVSRMTLDWLTWCASLGVEIETIELVMQDPVPLGQQCAARWENIHIEHVQHDEPLRLLLEQMQTMGVPAEQEMADPRRSLTVVKHRASRTHRRFIRLATASLLLLSVGVGSLGVRWHNVSKAHQREAQLLEGNNWLILERAISLDAATLADLRSRAAPDLILESEVALAQDAAKPIVAPPDALPLFEENRMLLELLSQQEGLTLTAINIDIRQSTVTFTSREYAPAEALVGEVRRSPSKIRWTNTSRGQPPNLFWEFKGEWKDVP